MAIETAAQKYEALKFEAQRLQRIISALNKKKKAKTISRAEQGELDGCRRSYSACVEQMTALKVAKAEENRKLNSIGNRVDRMAKFTTKDHIHRALYVLLRRRVSDGDEFTLAEAQTIIAAGRFLGGATPPVKIVRGSLLIDMQDNSSPVFIPADRVGDLIDGTGGVSPEEAQAIHDETFFDDDDDCGVPEFAAFELADT